MKAVLIRDYACAPEGHTVLQFIKGETLTGRAAELAVADGAAKFDPVEETKPLPPLTTKRGRK